MKMLADISSFLSLQNPSQAHSDVAVFNRLLWRDPVDEAIMEENWRKLRELTRGKNAEIDALFDAIERADLCNEFMLGVIEEDDREWFSTDVTPEDKSWWEEFPASKKSGIWKWIGDELAARQKDINAAEAVQQSIRDEFINDEHYNEYKRMSLAETGKFDDGVEVYSSDGRMI